MKESQKITIAVIALIVLIGGLIGGIIARAPKQDAADKEYEAYYTRRYDTVLLPVDDVKYVSSYETLDESSYVDQMMMVHPEQMIHKWATNYITIRNGFGLHAFFTIADASIRKQPSKRNNFVDYTGNFRVDLRLISDDGEEVVRIRLQASKTVTAPENESVRQKELRWVGLTYDLIAEMNIQFAEKLQSNRSLPRYLAEYSNTDSETEEEEN
ncbi:MAG TPA: hypothetical protein DD624_07230 [Alphaproteobacteria bacterium]|nr:hypothetical protein [Alphaproteobacteria bacterium]